jgi:hypothetical protein
LVNRKSESGADITAHQADSQVKIGGLYTQIVSGERLRFDQRHALQAAHQNELVLMLGPSLNSEDHTRVCRDE